MSSFFPFSSAASPASTVTPNDETHLRVTVLPSASAFYAGETFSAIITFTNTRPATHAQHIPPPPTPATTDVQSAAPRPMPSFRPPENEEPTLPRRQNQIGLGIKRREKENAEAGPSRQGPPSPLRLSPSPMPSPGNLGYPYSPGANPAYRAPGWPDSSTPYDGMPGIRSPEAFRRREASGGHSRKTRSLALGKGGLSPQEMVWALGGQPPPPLPTRRPQGQTSIPSSHPHSRKISITSALSPPVQTSTLPGSSGELPSIAESGSHLVQQSGSGETASRTYTSSGVSSTSQSVVDLTDSPRPSMERGSSRPRLSRNPSSSSRPGSSRTPSYYNAYGASALGVDSVSPLPPPTHPYIRDRAAEPKGQTTILWAYTRLVSHFHPSNHYIPPDPLLPLRSMLLHQPVGSGSLNSPGDSSQAAASTSRWQLSFGTGTIGTATQPSLTGSLFGLAKDLVYGGAGGSLEEERKRVWNMKDLPVLETARSLLGVDLRLREGESKEFLYTLKLPVSLPPVHRGKAYRFSYDLIISLTVGLPGQAKRQRSRDISVPIRVWANVSLSKPLRTYDVLAPIIQTTDEGKVEEQTPMNRRGTGTSTALRTNMERRRSSGADGRRGQKIPDSEESLREYAKHLVEHLEEDTAAAATPEGRSSPRMPPMSPSKIPSSRLRTTVAVDRPVDPLVNGHRNNRLSEGESLSVPNGSKSDTDRPSSAMGGILDGDHDLLEVGEEGSCGEAVEVLSRHSAKASFDIAKDGEQVAELTLIKTTYRLGETVLAILTFNEPASTRRVLKLSAYLESHEIIPENLLPLSANTSGHIKHPPLARLHADYRSSYIFGTTRMAVTLDIPSDATPAFALAAGPGGKQGGIEWRVRLAFLVAIPAPRRSQRSMDGRRVSRKSVDGHAGSAPVHLLPDTGFNSAIGDKDNSLFAASPGLAPLVPLPRGKDQSGQVMWEEMKTELVECEIPIRVLAGNTAFVVRPSSHMV